jgi:hypothetical protein
LGFGVGVIIPAAWNCLNLFVTHLFEAGHTSRPETLMVSVGGVAHFLLIIACMAGFLQLRPRMKQWGQFFGSGLLASAYFAVIIITTAPRLIFFGKCRDAPGANLAGQPSDA